MEAIMGDIFLNFGEKKQAMETSSMGIPIPRSQHAQLLSSNDYSAMTYDGDGFSPCPPLVPNNSLANNSSNFLTLQPFEFNASNLAMLQSNSFLSNNDNFDDLEIKMEPMDELLDLGSLPSHNQAPEEHLLDDVNFEDLLNPEEMETSPTCLDPQHSSPAAMTTVRPDDVFGPTRLDFSHNDGTSVYGFTASASVPIKSETHPLNIASTFPPQGIGWKDPFLSVGGNTHVFQADALSPHESKHIMHLNQPSSASPLMQDHLELGGSYKCESPFSPVDSNSSALHDLLVNSPSTSHSAAMSPQSNLSPSPQMQGIPIGQSVPGHHGFLSSNAIRLSSSAPTNNSLDHIWQRREPRRHLLSTGTLDEEIGGSTSSLSTGCGVISPVPNDFSIDDADQNESDDDSDVEHNDSESDNDSLGSEDHGGFSRKEKHFWQYNIQSKGPKGQKVTITKSDTDPHQLEEVMDPVFSPVCSIQGIKHSGKARRGDGNDLTPSPRKLVTIGIELDKLTKKINEMTPVGELPNNIRSKSRKEKNKLASRACRLKKKAQHEANKIKLHGLDQEHRAMMAIVHKVRLDLLKKVALARTNCDPNTLQEGSLNQVAKAQMQLSLQIEKNSRNRSKQKIAGNTTDFVNRVIENCRNGNPTGGLDELLQSFLRTSLSSDPSGDQIMYPSSLPKQLNSM